MVTNTYDLLVLNRADIHLTELISNLHFDKTLFIFQYFSHGSTNYLIDLGINYFYFRLYLRCPSSMMVVIFCHCNTSVTNGKFHNFNALWTSEIKVLIFHEVHALWYIYTSVCLAGADRKYIRVKETDNVKLDKKKTSIFFVLMYFLSAPVRQTEV